MTAWEFVKSYLSPVMLFFRLCWFGMGTLAALLAYSGNSSIPAIGLWGFAMMLYWLALRPWRTTNINSANKKLDEINNRYR
jgi:hypothetical protein